MSVVPGIYKAIGSEGYEFCHPRDEADYETVHVTLSGVPRLAE